MNVQKDIAGWLNRLTCPAFSVEENTIVVCNQAAEAMLISPGTDIRTLLLTGQKEYADFQSGCMYLRLNLSSEGCGATVTRNGDDIIFLLDQQPEDDTLRSLALAARDLRNPLSNLIIASDMIAKHAPEDPVLTAWLARMNRSIHQLHRLVNNMSDAAQSDLLTKVGMHGWNKLIYDIFEKIQTLLSGTGIRITYEGLQEEIYGYSNEGQLERAILNIVSNAMKFMQDTGSITAKLTRHNNMLHLSILDSGSGIAENVLANVFQRYRRQPGIEDSRNGIGLGMVLIRAAACNHGGTVLIDRVPGGGTRITMTMAIRQDASEFKTPVTLPGMEDSRNLLRDLSDCLPWEFYKKV